MTKPFSLTSSQETAMNQMIASFVDPKTTTAILQGPAGSGKTTVLKEFLRKYQERKKMLQVVTNNFYNEQIYFTATTHKAASVMSDILGTDVQTIHSFLGARVKSNFKDGSTFLVHNGFPSDIEANSIVIVDEISFADSQLMKIMDKSTKELGLRYLCIGDRAQLVPVSEGMVSPVFELDHIPTFELSEVMRSQNDIVKLSAEVRKSVETELGISLFKGNGIEFIDGPTFKAKVDQYFRGYQQETDMKIISWRNKKVTAYNSFVHTQVMGKTDPINPGDIMQNNSIVMNTYNEQVLRTDQIVQVKKLGRIHVIDEVNVQDVELTNYKTVQVPLDDQQLQNRLNEHKKESNWYAFFHLKDGLADLRHTYACTAHKSQGSTYDTVFIDLDDIGSNKNFKEVARLLYVAISRAKYKVYLYGSLPNRYLR